MSGTSGTFRVSRVAGSAATGGGGGAWDLSTYHQKGAQGSKCYVNHGGKNLELRGEAGNLEANLVPY